MPRPRVLINALSVTSGGGRAYIRNLLRELAESDRGYAFTVVHAEGQLSDAEACGIPRVSIRLPAASGVGRTLLRVLFEEVALPLRARRFDLLYCIADLAPRFCPAPTVVALRNLNIYDRRFFNDLRVRTLERLVRIGLRGADRVIFPTQAAADLVRQRIPIGADRVRIVPHGIAGNAFEHVGEAAEPEVPYLFLPAAIEPHKNIATLVASLPLIGDPDLEVWIAGPMTDYPDYVERVRRQIAELGVEDRVRLLGPVPYEGILRYHRDAVAMVFPSLLESFGHPLLEAMLAETPIIAADIPALREVAGDVAVYFDPNSPRDLANAVHEVCRDGAGTAARVRFGRARAEFFSWKRSTDLLCSVFAEALGER